MFDYSDPISMRFLLRVPIQMPARVPVRIKMMVTGSGVYKPFASFYDSLQSSSSGLFWESPLWFV